MRGWAADLIPLVLAEPMRHLATRSTLDRCASVLASMVSFFMLAHAMALVLIGLASSSGMPAFSKASAVFTQWFPVDSHTALLVPYSALALAANLHAPSAVLWYQDSSSTVQSASITHVTHFLFPMSIPILFSISLTSFFSWQAEAAGIYQDSRSSNTAARTAPFTP